MTDITTQRYRVCQPSSAMRAAPHDAAECTNEGLFGEQVQLASSQAIEQLNRQSANATVNEVTHEKIHHNASGQWLPVSAERDNYSGFMHASQLQAIIADTPAATHWVSARSTLVFSHPSIKSRVITRLPFLSRVASLALTNDKFYQMDTGGYIWAEHLLAMDTCFHLSAIELAQSHFLGAPYLWGGCSPNGLDCSGLIQALALAKGINIPRDSGDQEKALENTIAIGKQRSQDIVYWPGHTGILLDADTLLHSTAHSLNCLIEPLQAVVQRAGEITSIKRIFS